MPVAYNEVRVAKSLVTWSSIAQRTKALSSSACCMAFVKSKTYVTKH